MDPPSQQTVEDGSETQSPSETRRPNAYEFITGGQEGLSESFQSTNTVRRRPEAPYGK